MRKVSHLLCAMLGVLASGVFVSPAVASGYADPAVPPTEEIIIDTTAAGTGCREGVGAVTMAPGNSSLTVNYPDYTAKIGVGALSTDSRKNCTVIVTVHAPENVTFTVDSQDSTGYASIAPGASAERRASNSFKGQPRAPFMVNLAGTSDLKTTTSFISMESTVYHLFWRPCPVVPGV